MKIRVALVGAGRIAQSLARYLAQDVPVADFAAVVDVAKERAEGLARRFEVPRVFDSLEAALDDDSLQAVVVATPTKTHVDVIEAAAAAGKHILCEKPLALTVEGCDRAIAAASAAGVKLQVGFMRRFDPAYRRAAKLIQQGAIGRPVMFKASSRDSERTSLEFARRENSGGFILDMSIHDFDLGRWLMASEIEVVHALGGVLVYPELADVGDIDNVMLNVRFASGALGNIDASRNAVYGPEIRTEVLGSEGGLVVATIGGVPGVTLRQAGEPDAHFPTPVPGTRFSAAFIAELEAFLQWVAHEEPPPISLNDARMATLVAAAATRSFDEGRVIPVAQVEGHP